MNRTITRIAPASIIADAAAQLLATIERRSDLDEQRQARACNAVMKAVNQLYEGVNIVRDGDDFIFPSRSRTGISHRVNGTCDCEAAAEQGQPCWHRAAKRLVLMVEEAQRADAGQPPDDEGLPTSDDAPLPEENGDEPFPCPSCGSPMAWTTTPGGEECVECTNATCQRTIHADVIAAMFS